MNSGMLDTVPLTLTSGGAWGSTAMYLAASLAVMFCLHIVAQLKKNRFAESFGKLSGAAAPSAPFVLTYSPHALYASLRPPRSAMFSPCVSSPLTLRHVQSLATTDLMPNLDSENGPAFRS